MWGIGEVGKGGLRSAGNWKKVEKRGKITKNGVENVVFSHFLGGKTWKMGGKSCKKREFLLEYKI